MPSGNKGKLQTEDNHTYVTMVTTHLLTRKVHVMLMILNATDVNAGS